MSSPAKMDVAFGRDNIAIERQGDDLVISVNGVEYAAVNDIAYKVGETLPDGTIMGGISPETGKPMDTSLAIL